MEISQAGRVYLNNTKERSPNFCGLQEADFLVFTLTQNYSFGGADSINGVFHPKLFIWWRRLNKRCVSHQ